MNMPRIDMQALWRKLSAEDMAIVRRVVRDWKLRSSRPKIHDSAESRYAIYVWRMVAFQISPNVQHHCIPTTCFWYLPKNTSKAVMQRLDSIVDAICDTVPNEEWWGIRAWCGLDSLEAADERKFFMKGWKNDACSYFADSEARKARFKDSADHGGFREHADTGSPPF
jgi:hypothetical protein